jgi:hypothetical protein
VHLEADTGLHRIGVLEHPGGNLRVSPPMEIVQYPRMWRAAGLGYRDLLDVLVATALTGRSAARSAPRPGT